MFHAVLMNKSFFVHFFKYKYLPGWKHSSLYWKVFVCVCVCERGRSFALHFTFCFCWEERWTGIVFRVCSLNILFRGWLPLFLFDGRKYAAAASFVSFLQFHWSVWLVSFLDCSFHTRYINMKRVVKALKKFLVLK